MASDCATCPATSAVNQPTAARGDATMASSAAKMYSRLVSTVMPISSCAASRPALIHAERRGAGVMRHQNNNVNRTHAAACPQVYSRTVISARSVPALFHDGGVVNASATSRTSVPNSDCHWASAALDTAVIAIMVAASAAQTARPMDERRLIFMLAGSLLAHS